MATPQSPSYDADFEEMMRSMRITHLHSSGQRSPAAQFLDLRNEDDLRCSPAPLSDLTAYREVESPRSAKSACNVTMSPALPAPPPCSPLQLPTPKNLANMFGHYFEKKLLHSIAERDSADEASSDSGLDDNMEELDLNATYSTKTMSRRKLSFMLSALDDEEELAQQPRTKSPNLGGLPTVVEGQKGHYECTAVTYVGQKQLKSLPKPEYLKPSPQTPRNVTPLLPERSFRLCNYTRKLRKEQPKVLGEWGGANQPGGVTLRTYAAKRMADSD